MRQNHGSRTRARGRGARGTQNSTNHDMRSYPISGHETTGHHGEYNSHISERFGRGTKRVGRNRQFEDKIQRAEASGLELSLNPKIRAYLNEQDAIQNNLSGEEWLKAPEIATSEELSLSTGDVVSLPANRVQKPYKSVAKYLKTQYALLREDAVGNLRDSIDKFRRCPDMPDDYETSIYEKVHIAGITFTQQGIAARIKFSMARVGKRVQWSGSKRLVSGSIVALSNSGDNFKTSCIIAIVAARPLVNLDKSPPEIDIYFSCPKDSVIDPQQEFVMLEAKSGYYEAHRHTLRALQKLSSEKFPLSDNIIAKSLDIAPPKYLVDWPYKSLTAACSVEAASGMSRVDILEAWPDYPRDTSLDSSQWDALQQILTKSLSIIQGPPGTGKTHVSKVALQILAENRSPDDPPIIVAAQTNHALDQLLEHVATFDPYYIRLGGRSTSAEVKKRALFEIRVNERIPQVPGSGFGRAKSRLNALHATFGNILSLFAESTKPMSAETFFLLGILTQKQRSSLEDAVKNWVTAESTGLSAMEHWLHKALIPFHVTYNEDNFGFEELEDDLEVEQLRETEAEHGVADEEDIELLEGPWTALVDSWTVPDHSDIDKQRAKQLLDTKSDLWTVPEYLRGPMYQVMQQKAKDLALARFREAAAEYDAVVREIKIGKWEKDAVYLKRANIIGMTTTGLSKYRPLIAGLEPKIILIEEAAEVIEAPISVACVESLQHLILVGDHKQLQGHCSVRELEGADYNLNVSMFERLVNMNMPFKTLLTQRRMNPEFRALVSPLYPGLIDHQSVLARPESEQLWGTGKLRSFFFNHEWSESRDDSMSTYNAEEARLVAKFYRYLLHNDIAPQKITILTFYNGQRRRILAELRKDEAITTAYALVKTVDSYQGEENAIVILSLARSNDDGKIGFLDNENRVCVALSRAKFGFYIFGNADLVASRSRFWSSVVNQMKYSKPTRYGDHFPVQCRTHQRTTLLRFPEDWDEVEGGCDSTCDQALPCGHICNRKCHGYTHDTVLCQERCDRHLACGHNCPKLCHEQCHCACDEYETATTAAARAMHSSHANVRSLAWNQSHVARNTGSEGVTHHSGFASTTCKSVVRADGMTAQRPIAATRFRNGNGVGTQLARGGGAFQNQEHTYDFPSQEVHGDGSLAQVETLDRMQQTSHPWTISKFDKACHEVAQTTASEIVEETSSADNASAKIGHAPATDCINEPDNRQKDLLGLFTSAQDRADTVVSSMTGDRFSNQVTNQGHVSSDAGIGRTRYVEEYQPSEKTPAGFGFPPPHRARRDARSREDEAYTVTDVMEKMNLMD